MENKKGKKKLDLKKLKITKLNIEALQQVKGGSDRTVCNCTSDLIECSPTTGSGALFFEGNIQ
ncbi:class I lanthipeptide [Aquimarina sp. AU119]|uniref:class I lanthipeptide n=1 Tax=Aquimarina sp. AU119 TaxID=2108528 RepID=UPI000D68CF3B|nr:class I lanthipeptide [Aquimarina sp. AU119]